MCMCVRYCVTAGLRYLTEGLDVCTGLAGRGEQAVQLVSLAEGVHCSSHLPGKGGGGERGRGRRSEGRPTSWKGGGGEEVRGGSPCHLLPLPPPPCMPQVRGCIRTDPPPPFPCLPQVRGCIRRVGCSRQWVQFEVAGLGRDLRGTIPRDHLLHAAGAEGQLTHTSVDGKLRPRSQVAHHHVGAQGQLVDVGANGEVTHVGAAEGLAATTSTSAPAPAAPGSAARRPRRSSHGGKQAARQRLRLGGSSRERRGEREKNPFPLCVSGGRGGGALRVISSISPV